MKKSLFFAATIAALAMFSCNKMENVATVGEAVSTPQTIVTKAAGDKTPSILCYVETNDVNPLNALCCTFDDGVPLIDYVVLFASNIHKTTVSGAIQPTLYFNPELTPIMQGSSTYIQPLRTAGQKVLLGVLGDWVNLGLSNMTTTQAEQFATILAYAVSTYNLDGVSFDDEYSGTSSVVSGSFSTIISKYRELRPNDVIHVFDWGGTSSISSTAAAEIDYAGHGYFSYSYYRPYNYSSITGMDAASWSPISLNLGSSYTAAQLSTIASNVADAVDDEYGQILLFNLRTCDDVCHKPVFQAIATGAGWGTLTCSELNEEQPAAVSGGYTITYTMATAN